MLNWSWLFGCLGRITSYCCDYRFPQDRRLCKVKSRDIEYSAFRNRFAEGSKLHEGKDEAEMKLTLPNIRCVFMSDWSGTPDHKQLLRNKDLTSRPQHLAFLQQLLKLMDTMIETMLWLATLCYRFTSGTRLGRSPLLLEATRSIKLLHRMSDVRWAKMFLMFLHDLNKFGWQNFHIRKCILISKIRKNKS